MKETIVLAKRDFNQSAISLGIWNHLIAICAESRGCSEQEIDDEDDLTIQIISITNK